MGSPSHASPLMAVNAAGYGCGGMSQAGLPVRSAISPRRVHRLQAYETENHTPERKCSLFVLRAQHHNVIQASKWQAARRSDALMLSQSGCLEKK